MVNSVDSEGEKEYLKKLVRKRDCMARRIVRIASNLDNVSAVDSHDVSIDAARIDCDDLEKCFAAFESTQNEIEEEISEDELAHHEAERIRIEELVRNARVSASNFIRRSAAPIESLNANTTPVVTTSATKIKRPEITVPKFSGEVKKWSEFRNVFKSLVIDEKLYSDVEKMIYLKQAVEGKASELIANFEISRENFAKAWEKLRRRYENRRAVISTHLDALCKLPIAKFETEVAPLLDAATDAIESLSAAGVQNGWELMLCHLVSAKLDPETRKQWELLIVQEEEYPTYAKLEKFLHERVRVFESIRSTSSSPKSSQSSSIKKEKPVDRQKALVTQVPSQVASRESTGSSTRVCFDCGASSHALPDCKIFLAKSKAEKTQVIQKRGLCFNCLNRGHRVVTCRLKRCEKCGKKHHILLHPDEPISQVETTSDHVTEPTKKEQVGSSDSAKVLLTSGKFSARVCLPVALVYVFGRNGHRQLVRAFLDSCGGINAISERLVKKLQCSTESSRVSLSALVPGEFKISHSCDLTVNSRVSEYKLKGKFQVLPTISNDFASFDKNSVDFDVFKNYQLADDPSVDPGRVDLLIGTEFYEEVMLSGKVKVGDRAYLRESTFGWVFIGVTKSQQFFDASSLCFLTLEAKFQRFWTIDEMSENCPVWTPEEKRVDEEFERTFARDLDGRFIVFLPKNLGIEMLGESRNIAFRRLLSLERRLHKSVKMFVEYNKFLVEYKELKHMICIDSSKAMVYLPHHAILRESSSTTRTRVVFNASCATSSGYSLNDVLAKGPVLQEDLFIILMRFRSYKITFTADIEKMYRQILVHPTDRKLQCILWRDNVTKSICTFQLNTLTYGTKPASYLATKCLVKLADLFSVEYPESAEIVKSDFYMDDLLSGADSLEEAKIRVKEITEILNSGCFPLRKFASNSKELLHEIDPSKIVKSHSFEDSEDVAVLGVTWNSQEDKFVFFCKFSVEKKESVLTKRLFLSKIFRIFDPLGLLAPIVISLKFLLQELWRSKIDWDDPVPQIILSKFESIRQKLEFIPSLAVPRWVGFRDAAEIHVFCDASQRGYGAAVYVRSVSEQGVYDVQLLSAKSRVAPVKVVSLPRLELCAALLGANLFLKVKQALKLQKTTVVYAWSDSTIVLSWLYVEDRTWNTFVANRVSKIRSIIEPSRWFHVKSESNAADVISRGLESDFSQLQEFWSGPSFLKEGVDFLPFADFDSSALLESKGSKATTCLASVKENLFEKFSSYDKLISVVAYIMRFSKSLRDEHYESKELTSFERSRAHQILIRYSQATIVDKDKKKLDCFLDNSGILRLRGRIGKSDLTFESKYPIVLPKDQFLLILIEYWHLRFFHAGRSFLKNFVRSSYHVLGDLNRIIRGVTFRCVTCRRFAKNLHYSPPVGELPLCRVTISQAFVEIGVDFAGPFQTRAVGPGRNKGKVLFKSYVAIFVCMASRAVHIEVVEDLSTKAFLDSFARFTSRRGLCRVVHSDHGTNFIGADRELRCAFEFLKKNRSEFINYCSKLGIAWKFIPERAPHFGGLWEAAVKSFKYHFKRIVGVQILSYSELSTLTCQIEAVLNARPICTFADDSSTVITPAHLCIGRSISILPPITGEVVKGSAKVRYCLVRSIFDRFWAIWRQEYLVALRKGYFRKVGSRAAQVDDIVLLQESNTPPSEWPMGRIVKCYLGSDGTCRVVDVLTRGKVFRRPVIKLSPLLPDSEIS